MAYRTFNDFDSFQPSFSDYVVGYSPLRGEYRTQIITLSNLITGGGTVLYNYFSTVSAAINAVIGLSAAYTVVAQNSANWNSTNPAYTSLSAGSITARYVDIFHTPANDGTNPIIRIGEIDRTSGNAGFSGVYISYNEITNTFGISSQFAPGPGVPVLNIDRFGAASGPMLPYTVTFSKFMSAANGTSTTFYPASLSGMIPAAEITSRIREGKGMMRGSFLFSMTPPGTNVNNTRALLQFGVNPDFTGPKSVLIFNTNFTANAQSSSIRVFESFVIDNLFVTQSPNTNPYSITNNELVNFPYGVDLYYRAGFLVGSNNTICALSGGSISIMP